MFKAAREDVLPAAPESPLNVPIGPRRSLVGHLAPREAVRAARSDGGTINDVGLAVVAGALRAPAERRGAPPGAPWKAMVPVSMRRPDEAGAGNRIAMVAIELPVHVADAQDRLGFVRAATRRLKDKGRAEGTYALMRAGGPSRRRQATPSLHMLGCEMQETAAHEAAAAR